MYPDNAHRDTGSLPTHLSSWQITAPRAEGNGLHAAGIQLPLQPGLQLVDYSQQHRVCQVALLPGQWKSLQPVLLQPVPFCPQYYPYAWPSIVPLPAPLTHLRSVPTLAAVDRRVRPVASSPHGPLPPTTRQQPISASTSSKIASKPVLQQPVLPPVACGPPSPDVFADQPTVPPPATEKPEAVVGWCSLVTGVLQHVFIFIEECDVKSFRAVCQHWKTAADQAITKLTPRMLKSKVMVSLFPRLQVLQLIQCPNIRNRDLFVLSQSALCLKVLTIGDDTNKPWVTNRGLTNIAQITTLQCLRLHDCNSVTNNGLAALNRLKLLTTLSLKGCKKITNAGLEALRHNTALLALNLYGCIRVSDKGLLPLLKLQLQSLHLGFTKIKDEGLGHIARITSIRDLTLTKEEVTDAGVGQLSKLVNLQSLALRNCCEMSGDALLFLLPHLTNLQRLDMYKNWEFGDNQLSQCLPHLLQVQRLDLRGTWVREEGLASLTRLSALRQLAVSPQPDMWSDALCVLSSLTQLTSLSVNFCCQLTPRFVASLGAISALRDLNLSCDTPLEELPSKEPLAAPVVDSLARLSSLTSLDLSRRAVHEQHVVSLATSLRLLHTLHVSVCPGLLDDVRRLKRAFPALTIVCKVAQEARLQPGAA